MLALQREIGNVHDRFAAAVTAQPAATIVGRYGGAASSIFLAEDSVRDLPYFGSNSSFRSIVSVLCDLFAFVAAAVTAVDCYWTSTPEAKVNFNCT